MMQTVTLDMELTVLMCNADCAMLNVQLHLPVSVAVYMKSTANTYAGSDCNRFGASSCLQNILANSADEAQQRLPVKLVVQQVLIVKRR